MGQPTLALTNYSARAGSLVALSLINIIKFHSRYGHDHKPTVTLVSLASAQHGTLLDLPLLLSQQGRARHGLFLLSVCISGQSNQGIIFHAALIHQVGIPSLGRPAPSRCYGAKLGKQISKPPQWTIVVGANDWRRSGAVSQRIIHLDICMSGPPTSLHIDSQTRDP